MFSYFSVMLTKIWSTTQVAKGASKDELSSHQQKTMTFDGHKYTVYEPVNFVYPPGLNLNSM